MTRPYANKYTGHRTYELSADGNTASADTFKHPGGKLSLCRKDDADVTGGTTKLQLKTHPDEAAFVDITGGTETTEMTDSDAKELFLPECEISINTASYAASSGGKIRVTLQSL